MDKDQNIEIVDTQDDEASNDLTKTDHQEDVNQTVVVKKSGGNMALLFSLVALALSGYLFYKDWQQQGIQNQTDNNAELVQKIQNKNTQLESKISQFQQLLDTQNKAQKQLEEKLNLINSRVADQTVNDNPNLSFDNSDNEVAIQRLQSQLANQAQLIESLQAQVASPTEIQSVGQLPNNDFDALQKNRVIQSLAMAQTLLDTGQIPAALSSLEHLQQSTTSGFDHRNQLQSIINQVKQIRQPEPSVLKQRLSAANSTVQNLQLPMQEVTEESESKWYERFISVKKIEPEQGLDSTFELMTLKSQLSHLLQSAEILLNLQNESAWQQNLLQAADMLQQQLPKQQDLINELQQLAAEPIKAKVPNNLRLMVLVEELKRSF